MWGNEMGVVQAKMAGPWAKLFRLEVLFRAFLLLSDLLIPNLLILNQLFHHSLLKADLHPRFLRSLSSFHQLSGTRPSPGVRKPRLTDMHALGSLSSL